MSDYQNSKISELPAGTVKADSLFETEQSGATPSDPNVSTKVSATDIGNWVNTDQAYQEINNSTPIAAIAALMSAVSDLQTTVGNIEAALPEVESDILTAGQTQITLTNDRIVAGCIIRPFNKTDILLMPDSAVVDTVNHTVELTFTAQATDMTVGVEII